MVKKTLIMMLFVMCISTVPNAQALLCVARAWGPLEITKGQTLQL